MMKKYQTPLFVAVSTLFLIRVGDAEAFFPTIDPPATVQAIMASFEQTKTGSSIIQNTKTLSEITSAIGDAVNTAAGLVGQAQDLANQAMEYEKKLESYKEQFEKYRSYVEQKAEQTKFAAEMMNMDGQAVGSLLGGSIKDQISDKLGIPSPDLDLSFDYNSANPQEDIVEEEIEIKEVEVDEKPAEQPVEQPVASEFRKRGEAFRNSDSVKKTGSSAAEAGALKTEKLTEEKKAVLNANESKSTSQEEAAKLPANDLKDTSVPLKSEGAFRKPRKLNMSENEGKSFFYKRAYPLVFAAAAPEQKLSTLNTGRADDGSCIIPERMAEFCGKSVEAIQKDATEIRKCISMILERPEGSKMAGASAEDIYEIRRQNASCALGLYQKETNDAASEDQNVKDLDDKTDNVTSSRDLSAMFPFYTMEMAKMFNAASYARSTDMVYELLFDIETFDVKSFDLKSSDNGK